MKNILIPTDFSANSWNALKYALSFFEKEHCNFYLLHVASWPTLSSPDKNILTATKTTRIQKSKTRELLRQFLVKAKRFNTNPEHYFETILENVYFIDSIRKVVAEKEIDLIIMGTKGASATSSVALGSHTGEVITKVKCNTLIVPENSSFNIPKEIGFPTDFNLIYSRQSLKPVLEIIREYKSVLRMLHLKKKEKNLSEYQESSKLLLDKLLDNVTHTYHYLTNSDMEVALQCFIESRDIDLLVLIAKNLNYFQSLLFQPKVEHISYHTEIPFMVIHE